MIAACAAAALSALAAEARAESCGAALPATCLQAFGAGVLAAQAADEAEGAPRCAARLAAYRDCVSAQAARAPAAPGPALTRAERGFLAALERELADNMGRVGAFVEAMDVTGRRAIYAADWPALRLRFFNATDNPAYFAAPADWLARTQGLYDDLETLLARDDVRAAFRRQAAFVLSDRRAFKREFEALVALGRDRLLPEISAALAR
ncbi:MAG: hypothetical protein AAFR16_15175 [Pseudomonadota bacterium]